MNTAHLKEEAVSKLDSLKESSLHHVHDAQVMLENRKTALRDGVKTQVSRTQESMRINPMKWAGIAAASGLAIGLVGRIVQWRRSRAVPNLVVIESSC